MSDQRHTRRAARTSRLVTAAVAAIIASSAAGCSSAPAVEPGPAAAAQPRGASLHLTANTEEMPPPPDRALAAPASSIGSLSQVPSWYWARDYCRYYQAADGTWWSDVCVRTVPDTNQWGYQPNVGIGRPEAGFLVLFDTTEPQFTTVRFPNDPPFSTNANIGWIRLYPNEPNRSDWLIRNSLDGQMYWLTGEQLANELQAGRNSTWGFPTPQSSSSSGTVPGVTPGSAAANPANTAVLTQLSMQTVNAMNAPATALLMPKCERGSYCF
jgi:hypothetical protein